MTIASMRKPFHFERWIVAHSHLLKPPVGNKLVFEDAGMVVQVVGGPNQRVDFHDDPGEEFFYQLRGDMVLKLAEGGRIYDVPIREGGLSVAFASAPLAAAPDRGLRRSRRRKRPWAGRQGRVRMVLLRVRGARPPRRDRPRRRSQGSAAAICGFLCQSAHAHVPRVR
jgi:hypothetical protein